MNERRISYVIPTLNSGATLDSALLSLVSQSRISVNVIVADSGSTDETLAICRRWQVPVVYAEPGNMYRAINAGLRQCRTEWLAYLNSDDWLYPDALRRLLAQADKSQAEVVYGHTDFVDGAGRFMYSLSAAAPAQVLSLFRMQVMAFTPHAAVFRRSVYERFGGFDEKYSLSADADFFLRLVRAGIRLERLEGPPVACFRLHGQQQTQTRSAAMESERARIYDNAEMKPGWRDQIVFFQWRLGNLPHYLVRILRASLLVRRLRVPGSMDVPTYS